MHGANFVVAAVDNTRRDGQHVPTLQHRLVELWWAAPRSVSLIEVPEAFIDQYDVHLKPRGTDSVKGWDQPLDGLGDT
jgi:beta-glucuronidase